MNESPDILKYIPQRPPFVMVDKLTSVSENKTITIFTIQTGNIFCEDGLFYEGGIIENIAQSAAASAGYKHIMNHEEIPVGMIGSVKKLQIARRPEVGDTLQTEISLVANFDNAQVVEGSVSVNNETIASCQMNIFIFKSPQINL